MWLSEPWVCLKGTRIQYRGVYPKCDLIEYSLYSGFIKVLINVVCMWQWNSLLITKIVSLLISLLLVIIQLIYTHKIMDFIHNDIMNTRWLHYLGDQYTGTLEKLFWSTIFHLWSKILTSNQQVWVSSNKNHYKRTLSPFSSMLYKSVIVLSCNHTVPAA